MSKINRHFFFDHARLSLFDGGLKPGQVTGLNALLDYWEEKHATSDDRWLAYILATAHHETDRTMAPIREYGNETYFIQRYDPPSAGRNPNVARQLGNNQKGDGPRYCGRGFVQLTGRRNYTDWGNRLSCDLANNPLLAMDLAIATKVLIDGSVLGTFTGKKLGDYINGNSSDFRNARRIINGVDKADLIASYAKKYYAGISYTV